MNSVILLNSNDLLHYGVQGMRWGIRNYQPYPDGYSGNGRYVGQRTARRTKAVDAGIGAGRQAAPRIGTRAYMDMMNRRRAAAAASTSSDDSSSRSRSTSRRSSSMPRYSSTSSRGSSGGRSGGSGSKRKSSGVVKENTINVKDEYGNPIVLQETKRYIHDIDEFNEDANGYSSTRDAPISEINSDPNVNLTLSSIEEAIRRNKR